MSAVKAASHTNKMAAAVKPLTTAKPKRAAIRPTEERAKAPTEMRVLLTWTGIFLELIRRTTRSLTAKVSGPQNAGPLDRRVRPEGQKGALRLEDVRSPRKSAGPRKRCSAARRIAGGA